MPPDFNITVIGQRPAAAYSSLPCADVSAELALIVDVEDRPVWPIHGPDDASMLAEVARLFGSLVRWVEAKSGFTSSATGLVVGLGELLEETRLYAHLTRRRYRLISRIRELFEATPPEVLVVCMPSLTPELIELLIAMSEGVPMGVIWGRTREELKRLVLSRSAASVLNGPVVTHQIVVTNTPKLAERALANGTIFGEDARRDRVTEALSSGAGLVTINAHGSGSSVRLAPNLRLCAIETEKPRAERTHAPACVTTGYCEMAKLSVTQAMKDKALLRPRELSMRVLALGSCQAIFVGSDALHQSWSYFPLLNANHRIGAIAATPDLAINVGLSEDLCEPLVSGMSVGAAVASYNAGPTAHGLGQRRLLFGDPRTRAAPAKRIRLVARPLESRQKRVRRETRIKNDDEATVLRLIAQYKRSDTHHMARNTSARALEAVTRYEESGRPATSGRQEALLVGLMLPMLLHLGTMKGRTYEGWLRHAEVWAHERRIPCPNCSWRAVRLTCTLATGHTRIVTNCARCGNVEDAPSGIAREIFGHLPTLELVGTAPIRAWAAATYVVPESGDPTIHFWPGHISPERRRCVTLPAISYPAGPLAVRTVVMEGATIYGFGRLATRKELESSDSQFQPPKPDGICVS
jgi:hypothetical protein